MAGTTTATTHAPLKVVAVAGSSAWPLRVCGPRNGRRTLYSTNGVHTESACIQFGSVPVVTHSLRAQIWPLKCEIGIRGVPTSRGFHRSPFLLFLGTAPNEMHTHTTRFVQYRTQARKGSVVRTQTDNDRQPQRQTTTNKTRGAEHSQRAATHHFQVKKDNHQQQRRRP